MTKTTRAFSGDPITFLEDYIDSKTAFYVPPKNASLTSSSQEYHGLATRHESHAVKRKDLKASLMNFSVPYHGMITINIEERRTKWVRHRMPNLTAQSQCTLLNDLLIERRLSKW